jgi:hypothetical protein
MDKREAHNSKPWVKSTPWQAVSASSSDPLPTIAHWRWALSKKNSYGHVFSKLSVCSEQSAAIGRWLNCPWWFRAWIISVTRTCCWPPLILVTRKSLVTTTSYYHQKLQWMFLHVTTVGRTVHEWMFLGKYSKYWRLVVKAARKAVLKAVRALSRG